MLIRTLVDGYNLLHRSPWLERGRGAGWLEKARARLIRGLATPMSAAERSSTQIIFDAGQTPSERLVDQSFQGLQVKFAVGFDQADDLLEAIIRQHSQPNLLTVVSSDHRIQRCAKACKARWVECEDWLHALLAREANAGESENYAHEKYDILGEEQLLNSYEIQLWLTEFGVDLTRRDVDSSEQADNTEVKRAESNTIASETRASKSKSASHSGAKSKRAVTKPVARNVKVAKAVEGSALEPAEKMPRKNATKRKPSSSLKKGSSQKKDIAAARKRARRELVDEIPPLDSFDSSDFHGSTELHDE